MSLPFCRSYMFVSTSRTIGKKISPGVSSKSGIGPTLIIWWTAGVSGIAAPAIVAIRGLQTPQQTKTYSVSIGPLSVCTRRTRPFSTSIPVTSVLAETVSAPRPVAASRISVPARSESTQPTAGVWKPPRMISSLMKGTSSFTCAGVSSSEGSPHEIDEVMRRLNSSSRSWRPRDLDPAAHRVHAELDVLLRRVARERRHLLRVVDGEDEVGGVSGRAARVRERPLVEQHEVAPAEPGEVMNHAVADDAGADDDRLRARGEVRHRALDPTSCSSCRSSPSVPTSRTSSRRPMSSAACSA